MLLLVLSVLVVLSVYDQMIIQLSDWWWCGRGCSIQVYYCSVSTQQLLDFLLIGNDNCQPVLLINCCNHFRGRDCHSLIPDF